MTAQLWIDDIGENGEDAAGTMNERGALEPVAVPVEDEAPVRARYTDRLVRPASTFVAHLMAIDGGYPQTRATFRAEPGPATAAYRSAVGQGRTATSGRGRRV